VIATRIFGASYVTSEVFFREPTTTGEKKKEARSGSKRLIAERSKKRSPGGRSAIFPRGGRAEEKKTPRGCRRNLNSHTVAEKRGGHISVEGEMKKRKRRRNFPL